ncbi:SH3 domain-containing protein [Flavobacterium aurantiibacter]|uniref:Uncharacterized protein n=1 Tax=Flavobacterium aurantiibacter TaxID=2023067 RepID=A0A256A9N2_9FLAO|nr:hypothetical protein [Flavobacterium aurantiibacter]OYQ50383.1 hypothetical protein CHX27_00925 [Flavobacterium aurantiibacter]
MKILLLLLLLNGCIFGQKCNCETFIITDNSRIPIYSSNKKEAKIIYEIKNDSTTENYFSLKIYDYKDHKFLVKPTDSFNKRYKLGWISDKYVGIYANNYNSQLNLYDSPNETSKIIGKFEEYVNIAFQVRGCSNKWLYVFLKLNNKEYSGWMRPQDQCANIFTTCN